MSDAATLTAFVLMVVAIAGNVVAIKLISRNGDLDPLWAASSRFMVATAIFLVAARVMSAHMPRGRALAGAVLYGALSIGGFFCLMYYGLQGTSAGIAGVLLATGPLLTFALAVAHRQERFRWDSMAGGVVVVMGTAIVVGSGLDDGVPFLSMAAIVGASLCAAEGAIVVKAFPSVHPLARNAVGMGVGTAMILALMPLFGEAIELPRVASTWVAQAYLVIGGSVGVFGLYLFILGRWSASAVSYEFVVAPILAVVLGAWLLDERITVPFVIGSGVILAGVYLGVLRPLRGSRQASDRSPDGG